MTSSDSRNGLGDYTSRLLVTLLIAALAAFAWAVSDVLLLAFGAILFAVFLRGTADWIAARSPLPRGWALATTVLLLVVVAGTAVWLLGRQVSAQIDQLVRLVPESWENVEAQIQDYSWGRFVLDRFGDYQPEGIAGGVVREAGNALLSVVSAVGNTLLLVTGGVYMAVQPGLYRDGLVKLVPRGVEERVRNTLDAIGQSLGQWLKGQIIAMLLVGTLTSLGLWLLGVPSALALGLLAGLGEFVPLVGAVLTAIPALLAASSQGASTVLYVLILYLVIQQIEGNLIMPLVQESMVSLPPALTLFAVVALGLTFGIMGVLFATPLTVVAFVAVRELYVKSALGKVDGGAAA